MKYLGPLSSSPSGGRIFYTDFSNQLNSSEILSSINSVSVSNSNLTINNVGVLSSGITTEDGHLLPSGQAISFRAACTSNITSLVCVDFYYTTNLGNTDTTRVQLKLVEVI